MTNLDKKTDRENQNLPKKPDLRILPPSPESKRSKQVEETPAADNLVRFKLLSEADKTDIEVNQILIRRLMRALLADDRKAA
ncbi:MAG TPA: hypothetical protein G4N96_05735 [Chloroflexi bacterium]|nr:hypothetical protein [Chloroflexota bacterium]